MHTRGASHAIGSAAGLAGHVERMAERSEWTDQEREDLYAIAADLWEIAADLREIIHDRERRKGQRLPHAGPERARAPLTAPMSRRQR